MSGAFEETGAPLAAAGLEGPCCRTVKVKVNIRSSMFDKRRRKDGGRPLARLSGSYDRISTPRPPSVDHATYLDIVDWCIVAHIFLRAVSAGWECGRRYP